MYPESTSEAQAVRGYRLGEELARDERFVLCRAWSERDHCNVLVKRAHDVPAADADVARLEREFELLNSLPIDAITRPRQFVIEDGACALVLEDDGGVTLEALASKNRLPLGWVLDHVAQLAAVLTELRQCGVVHRGVRPQAVLIEQSTRRLRLADFACAARGASEAGTPLAASLSRGRLAYASPEQTGRIDRACDYRSDFYSLGVVMYELLTGRLPFVATDALELMHCHLAKVPAAPADLVPAVPLPVSQIAMKLLAKAPEERYQSALSLQRDLQRCREEWSRHGRVLPFVIAQRDVPEQFTVPQRLYGRDKELGVLHDAFERARSGPARLLLVTGAAGVGKTTLLRRLHEPVVRAGGHFVSGKFDQLARDVPYRALIEALSQRLQRMLTEPAHALALKRQRLQDALGENAAAIAALIPELALVLDAPVALPVLPPAETRNRLTLAFQNFVACLATAADPLVVLLDDLHWADDASLQLLQSMLASPAPNHLLLVAAYRDGEVIEGHPLLATLGALQEAGVAVDRIALAPLKLAALTSLTADTLHIDAAAAGPLASLLLSKAAGNPLFTIQFLMALHRDGVIRFDAERAAWNCQLEQVAAAVSTDDLADLLSRKLDRLAPVTQRVLTLAACIGHRFDARTLAVVSEQSLEATLSDLAEAALEGLIEAETEHVHAFVHDRVQQAAYARIPPEQRPRMHLSIGRLLLAQWDLEPADEVVFDIASHLNQGAALIEASERRLELARLNLRAGGKAKLASAYQAARVYFNAGIAVLDAWHPSLNHELAFALWFEAAQCEYLCGDFDRAEAMFATLLQHATSALDKARVHSLRMIQLENMSRYADALASAREGLSLFDVALPDDEAQKEAALEREVNAIEASLGQRSIASLIDLPTMSAPAIRMVMSILTDIWSPVYILGDAALARLISAMLVRLSLEHGNCEESAYGYVTHAITVGPVRQDYAAAYAFGTLALRVNERFDDRRRRAKIHQQFHAHVNLWCQPMRSCISYAKEACRSGLASGDFLYAAYAASTESWPAIVSCQNLGDCVRDLEPNLALVTRLKNAGFADALRLVMSWARALQGETDAPLSLAHAHGDGFDEADYAQTYRGNPFFTMFHAIARLHLCYLLDEQTQALDAVRSVQETAHRLTGMIWSVLVDFWGSLTLLANLDRAADAVERDAWLNQVRHAQATLAVLARSCAANFLCHSLLLQAELERIAGRHDDALALYERAVHAADETATVQHQAVANELFGRFWLQRGHRGVAAQYLRSALTHYEAWGARAKVRQLLARHADLLGPAHAGAPQRAEPEDLDLASIVKAARAIAESVEPDHLLERLLAIAIENAGARRGLLLESAEDVIHVLAESVGADGAVTLRHATPLLDQDLRCSRAMVDFVLRTRTSLVIGDAAHDERFAHDAYVVSKQPKSVLCLPIVHQGRISAILYLENDLSRDAFSPRRIELIQLLMAQGAISLANARLSMRMRLEMSERARAEDTLRAIEAGTASAIGTDFFRALVRNLASALHVRYAFVAECLGDSGSGRVKARSRAYWQHDDFGKDFEYDVPGTPCNAVVSGQTCHHADDLQALFPADSWLVRIDAKSYLGIPMLGSGGEVIGHMAILDTRPMIDATVATSVMKLSAGRAAAELERLKAAEGQQRALAQVEVLKNRLQEENVYLRRELIANVSHDLRSPLASLRAYIETLLLKEEAVSAAERRHYLEIALSQAEHLQALITELFELARLDFQGYRIDAEPVQLGELAHDVMQKLRLAAQDRKVTLTAAVDPDLGLVRADIGLIERTLTNLLENAMAHTPVGGRIELSVQARNARVVLRVRDSGSGIAADDLPRIFERFYRADKARSHDPKGSGLGLAIVKRILELHDSEIRVESELGRGATFWFELPLM
ncbi:MAG TPA: ATP-binding sensor histidine kinase [Burkholderiaceae bacterium]|nr:ATP-binding sensor histidine kinase [Burkholderiaceae bacterium]